MVWYLCKSASATMIRIREVIGSFEVSPLMVSTYHVLTQFPERFWDKKVDSLEVQLNNSLFSKSTLNVPWCVICFDPNISMQGLPTRI